MLLLTACFHMQQGGNGGQEEDIQRRNINEQKEFIRRLVPGVWHESQATPFLKTSCSLKPWLWGHAPLHKVKNLYKSFQVWPLRIERVVQGSPSAHQWETWVIWNTKKSCNKTSVWSTVQKIATRKQGKYSTSGEIFLFLSYLGDTEWGERIRPPLVCEFSTSRSNCTMQRLFAFARTKNPA